MNISIKEAIKLLRTHELLVSVEANENLVNDYISYNSKDIKENTMFFCKGMSFKKEYLQEAITQGVTTYVSEVKYDDVDDVNAIIVTDIQKAMALLSAMYFDNPQERLFIIAYTGTKGKTTSAYLTYSILEKMNQQKTALISTMDTIVGKEPEMKFKSKLTTPESLDLFREMRASVDNGMTHLVMEVSSQSYKKNRVYNLQYDVGIFLNISPDHIGKNEHPTFEDYLYCKKQIMANSNICIINKDTEHFEDVYDEAKSHVTAENIYLYSQTETEVDFQFIDQETEPTKGKFQLIAQSDKAKKMGIEADYLVNLPGVFNESNSTAAAIATNIAGANRTEIAQGLAETVVPGRMEAIKTKKHGFVYIDYAHNYASMKALLSFAKENHANAKIIVVVGSTGDKGISRREGFARALNEYADEAILTTDDPGFENPQDICEEIDAKVDHQKVTTKIVLDRISAISQALEMSNENSIVIIAGKGADPYQKIKGVDEPYPTDATVARTILDEID
ncbi:UDP-N-acetylmuramoyl-L-alanyl-D-glutamate--2,6-diaminopimelate ligase [Lactobacillus sp. YT155]|uniref:UDP-N-acetylmuramoyl-L-alanyl-D-glutamate--2, 6-diaminopimelate ligase n=1 Tax=Lactobacillus sp. YT155 TaxID=3060955 RepID=UPI00265F01ED|nr:UDP-N-acetylmuramoyl-L-alanyl-D-glutamate--2,6-diaminopimelate ligase [Lactobacillus sp. YT155]MDO1604969.1 UDP-N-acetylmuramoyl-L-alanyl-D-glutamate--2,6-diaminopimelate ligase [Lactobacillus sp. YT155]